MQLHSAVTSSSSLTGTPDDMPQLPVGQAPGSPGAVTRSARLASLHRAPSWLLFLIRMSASNASLGTCTNDAATTLCWLVPQEL